MLGRPLSVQYLSITRSYMKSKFLPLLASEPNDSQAPTDQETVFQFGYAYHFYPLLTSKTPPFQYFTVYIRQKQRESFLYSRIL